MAFSAPPSSTVMWLNGKMKFSVDKILENTSPYDGLKGAVLASKSRIAPDYYYHWVRDAAIAMSSLIDLYHTTEDKNLKIHINTAIDDYLNFSSHIQNISPNLGEPKFYANGNVYEKPWGRPQNDGPAMRAISLIHWANVLISEGKEAVVRKKLYSSHLPAASPIKKDLEYISHHWKEPSYDLWEEVKGIHFYTLMVIRRALKEGALLASRLGDAGAARWYNLQAKEIEFELLNFWDSEKKYITATINRTEGVDYKTSNLDTSIILGLIHGGMNDGFLSWDHPHVLSTINKIISVNAELYFVNQQRHVPGIAIGRYPEDRYGGDNFNGGNPWPLCTLAVAQALYEYANLLKKQNKLADALRISKRADQFVERVKYHANPDDSLSEQINRNSGYMISAENLTWNYAALLTTRYEAIA
jgi:glucoamylase